MRGVLDDAVGRLGEGAVGEVVQRTQTIRRDVRIAIRQRESLWGRIRLGARARDGRAFLGQPAAAGIARAESRVALLPLVGVADDLGVEMDGRHDQIDVLGHILRDAVVVAGDVLLARGVFVDFVFGLEEAFDFGDAGVEIEPVPAARQGDAGGLDARGYEPVVDGVDGFWLGCEKVYDLRIKISREGWGCVGER